jgi:iron complex outermembrane recepter protein
MQSTEIARLAGIVTLALFSALPAAAQQAAPDTTKAVQLEGLVVVSATREARLKSRTPASVGTVTGAEIREVKPAHPSEILGRVAGVWVSSAGGEGHMTAIRQPKTTKPMYLFLEDGVPTRSTGFFNHNALYEVNLPQAERIEVLKGPATALYGSDAIGGVVSVETRRPTLHPEWEGSLERGSDGWMRFLGSAGGTAGAQGLRADLNLTRSDGFREGSEYRRLGGTLRWDSYLPAGATLRTVASYSLIDQHDASSLTRDLFESAPATNHNRIGFRKVGAFRLSSAFELPLDATLISITPFVRANTMELMPSWMLSYDPVVYTTGHRSLGVLARVRRDLPFWSARILAGADLEQSPGAREEDRITIVKDGLAYASYTRAGRIYDYDVTFRGVSPYAQADFAPLPRLNVSLGLRYDHVGFAYHTRLDPVATGRWRVPGDTTLWYDHLSPKVGATYEMGRALNLFASYRHGFRAPSEGQLFRQGSSATGAGLKPVRAESYEAGARGMVAARLSYEAALYRMDVADDILTYVTGSGATLDRVNANAGRTRHQGLELGLGLDVASGLRVATSYSNALHTHREWVTGEADYSGKRMVAAPRVIVNTRVDAAPRLLGGGTVGVEWVRIGSYFLDEANLHRYPGHDLFHLRAGIPVSRSLELDARITNLLDTRYAEDASVSRLGEEFTPGAPRSFSLSVQYRRQGGEGGR